MDNREIADALEAVGDLLEITEANPFRVRAYRNAARTVRDQPQPLAPVAGRRPDDLRTLPGIGADMTRAIVELVTTGRLGRLDELAAKVPRTLLELTRVPGLGPKRARQLWTEGGIANPARTDLQGGEGKEILIQGAEYAHPWSFIPGFSEINDAFNNALTGAIEGSGSAQEIADATQSAIESNLR